MIWVFLIGAMGAITFVGLLALIYVSQRKSAAMAHICAKWDRDLLAALYDFIIDAISDAVQAAPSTANAAHLERLFDAAAAIDSILTCEERSFWRRYRHLQFLITTFAMPPSSDQDIRRFTHTIPRRSRVQIGPDLLRDTLTRLTPDL